MMPKKTKFEHVYVVWANTDSTEGRGSDFPLYICRQQNTALRMAKGRYVMGGNCPVTKERCSFIEGIYLESRDWYGPRNIVEPSEEDNMQENCTQTKKILIQKLIDLGITQKEIKTLTE